MTETPTELIRYLALSGALFSVGLYGLFVRRSALAALMSLGVMLGALTLSAWAFNNFIRPFEMRGYLFGALLILLALVYALLARPLIDRLRAVNKTMSENPEAESTGSNKFQREDIISLAGLPLNVSLVLVFVVGYLLARVSPAGLTAFIVGVLALKYIIYRRYQKHLGKLSTASAHGAPSRLLGLGGTKATGPGPGNSLPMDQS